MFKPKRKKLTVSATPETTRLEKPFVQVEGKLTEGQLEAIADGLMKLTTLYISLKEELIFKQEREKLTNTATPAKNRPGKTFFQIEEELTKAQLEAIAAGGITLN